MKTTLSLIIGLSLLSFCSCEKSMEHVSVQEPLDEFDTLTLNNVFEVHLTQGTTNSIRIEGSKKIIENVSFLIENNTLTLNNSYKGNWIHPKKNKIIVYITTNGLSRINANETCNIQTTNALLGNEIGLVMTSKLNEADLEVNCNSFYFWNNHPCGGKVQLKGSTYELKVWNYALMAVEASHLTTQVATIENSSKGDCSINCLNKLTYSILGTGNIYLSGNPAEIIKIEETSTGRLIQ